MIISLFCLLFVCILFSMVWGAKRLRNVAGDTKANLTPLALALTQTKWWIKHNPSATPTTLISNRPTPIGTETPTVSIKCPAYASGFLPGTFGYISPSPPYENLVRSGAGKNYSAVGFIEIGDWVRILGDPVCTDDGYVWLNVQSAAGPSNWTAGGHNITQWVILCPDPNRKCSKKKATGLASEKPGSYKNGNNNDDNNPKECVSDMLAVGLDAQVSPSDLLVVRSEPFTGKVLGHIAPLAVINHRGAEIRTRDITVLNHGQKIQSLVHMASPLS